MTIIDAHNHPDWLGHDLPKFLANMDRRDPGNPNQLSCARRPSARTSSPPIHFDATW